MQAYIALELTCFSCPLLPLAVLPPGVMEAHHAKLEFFKASISEHMLERLVGKYMLLSEEELENWNTDTEDFCEFVCVFVRERERE